MSRLPSTGTSPRDSAAYRRCLCSGETPTFEGTRVRSLSIPSEVEWVEWVEDEDPYKQLPDIEGTVFVDGSIRHFIVDGLRTAFPKATVLAAPIEIRQVPERKSEGELVLLKCTNEVCIL